MLQKVFFRNGKETNIIYRYTEIIHYLSGAMGACNHAFPTKLQVFSHFPDNLCVSHAIIYDVIGLFRHIINVIKRDKILFKEDSVATTALYLMGYCMLARHYKRTHSWVIPS